MRCTSVFFIFCIFLAYAKEQAVLDAAEEDPNKLTPGNLYPPSKGWTEIKEFGDQQDPLLPKPVPALVPREKSQEFVDPDYVDYVNPQEGQPGYGEGPVIEAENGTPDVESYNGIQQQEEEKKQELEQEKQMQQQILQMQQQQLSGESEEDEEDPYVYPELRDVPEPLGSTGVIRFDPSTLTGTAAHLLDLALKNTVVPEYDIQHEPLKEKISKAEYQEQIEKARQEAILQDEAVDAKIQHSRDQLYKDWYEKTLKEELAKEEAEKANSDDEKYLTPVIVDKHGHPIDDLRLFYGTYPGNDLSNPQAFPTAPDYERKDPQQEYFKRLIEEQKINEELNPLLEPGQQQQEEGTVEGQEVEPVQESEGKVEVENEVTGGVDEPEVEQQEKLEWSQERRKRHYDHHSHRHHHHQQQQQHQQQQEQAEHEQQQAQAQEAQQHQQQQRQQQEGVVPSEPTPFESIEKDMEDNTLERRNQEKTSIEVQDQENEKEQERGDVDEASTEVQDGAPEAIHDSEGLLRANEDNALAAAYGYDIHGESPPPVVQQVVAGQNGAEPFVEELPLGSPDVNGIVPGAKIVDAPSPPGAPVVGMTSLGTTETDGDPDSEEDVDTNPVNQVSDQLKDIADSVKELTTKVDSVETRLTSVEEKEAGLPTNKEAAEAEEEDDALAAAEAANPENPGSVPPTALVQSDEIVMTEEARAALDKAQEKVRGLLDLKLKFKNAASKRL